jgi:alditol oxidase
MRNWSGSYEFTAPEVATPDSVDALREVVTSHDRVHAVGSGHSFHDIAESAGVLVSTAALPQAIEVDAAAGLVRVGGGVRYGRLAPELHRHGLALANLASLPHISVAGTIATGTHGSGDRNRTLSAATAGIELMTADGELRWIRRGDPDFAGAVVSLGALGIVTRVELDVVPAFELTQTVYDRLPRDAWLDGFDEITALGYSVSAFTAFEPGVVDSLWVKRRVEDDPAPASVLGSPARTEQRHMIMAIDAASTTQQGGVPGPWHERLPHFRFEFTPSAGEEVQTEYLLPRERAAEAIRALDGLRETIQPLLMISEVRTMAADDLWLSPAEGRDTVGLHFTWERRVPEVLEVCARLEEVLLPLGARPHWGKLFATADPLAAYRRADEFRALVARLDPAGRFRGPFLERYL